MPVSKWLVDSIDSGIAICHSSDLDFTHLIVGSNDTMEYRT